MVSEKNRQTSPDSTLRAAGVMGAATFLSRILGLVREQVFAVWFGASHANDAFQIAFRIPNLLRDLFAEGAMSAALVPTFVETRKKSGVQAGWDLARVVFIAFFAIGTALALVGSWWAPELVRLYASSFQDVPGKFELTVTLTRGLVWFFPWVVWAAALMAVLNAVGTYFIPALASAVFNLVSISTGIIGVMLVPRWGFEPIVGMAIGVVLGGAAQAWVQWPALRKAGYIRGSHSFSWSHPGLRRMAWLMIPGTVGLAATQINILVNSILATREGAGAVSWLNYAFRLMQFPIGIFGVSMASATLPAVSALWVEKNYVNAAQRIQKSMIQVFAVNLPAAAGLIAVGPVLIAVLFEHGAFTTADTRATAMALSAYALGLAFYSGVKVLVPVFYAFGNTRVPLISSAVAVAANLVLNLSLVGPFGYWGLALGTSATALINWMMLMIFAERILRRQGAGMAWIAAGISISKQFVAAVLMGWGTYAAVEILLQWEVPRAVVLLCGVTIGVMLTMILAIGFRMPETTDVLRAVKRRLWK